MQQEHLHQDYATRTPKISASFKLAASPPNPLFDAEMGNPFVAEDAPHLAMVATRPTIGSSTPSGKISFPFKLHAMLAELESTGQSHIASFQPHGRSFTIYKQDEFVSDVLPRWFHQCSYLSFEAKLKRYGFQIFKDGPRQSAFYHRKFLKDQPNLALTIQKLDPKRASRHGRRVRAVVQPREGLVPMPLWDVYSSRVPAAHAAQTSRHTNKTSTSRRNGACATDWRAIPHLSQPAETLCTASGRLIVPDENFSNHPNHSTDAVDDRLSAALMAINLSQGKDRHSSAGPAFKHERT